jgi:arylsulfatase A-like enzyme
MLSRREFTTGLAASAASLAQTAETRPNILWITCEDIGPALGCYGDTYADTPNLDRLATRAVRYDHAWSNAPVCAPARTTIISGLYPPCTGSENMRSMTSLPASIKMFPCYLREAGYYASNNAKEDYNLKHTGKVWDESSQKAHWRNRAPGQPFFAVFNLLITHESQIRTRPHKWIHDPAKARVPAYQPDTPEVRKDWAQYYDNITTMDRQAGQILKQLEDDGLADNTIVFFYGDHGSGMPRSKRWPYNSGLQVPLLVHIPQKFRHLASPDYKQGGASERMVGFIDLAPTVLSLAGVRPLAHMQGEAFLGRYNHAEREFDYGFRGRMDERYDLVRSVRDKRYIYIRNYMPHKIYGQHIAYMFETPTTTVWKKLYDEGKLKPPQTFFWETKPPEELYDLTADRDEVRNLAASPEHRQKLQELRQAQRKLALDTRDVGFLPEPEIHSRSKGSTPYEMGHDPRRYPLERIMHAAELASMKEDTSKLLDDPDSAVRYWAVLGFIIRGQAAPAIRPLLDDSAPSVRIAAAECLGRFGPDEDLPKCRTTLGELADPARNGVYVSLLALNAIDTLGRKAAPMKSTIAGLSKEDPNADKRYASYVPRLIEDILASLSQQ